MPSDPLQQPVGALMHPVELLGPADSLQRAANLVSQSRAGCCVYVHADRSLALINDQSLGQALAHGARVDSSAEEAARTDVRTVPIYASGAEALRKLDTDHSVVIVLDNGYPIGIVGAADLYPGANPEPTPQFIGGMATPFGVYLTTGNLGAGAGPVSLAATGFLMFGVFLVGSVITYWITGFMNPGPLLDRLSDGLPIVFFLLGLRLLPLSGIHAAEHKVVHAIERGEPLTLEAVRRMPRVHPRCGTNLAAGATLFMAIASSGVIQELEPRLLVAMLVTVFCWKPLGAALQSFVTTRPPNDRQLAGAIRAGEELLKKFRSRRGRPATVPERLWFSGLPFVIAGSSLAYVVVWALSELFGFGILG